MANLTEKETQQRLEILKDFYKKVIYPYQDDNQVDVSNNYLILRNID